MSALLALGLLRGTAGAQLPCGYVVSDIIQAPAGPFGLASPTQATAISPNGRYVVGFFNPGGIGYDRAFAYDTQTHQFLIIPLPAGGYQSYANDVNDAGVAVGSYWRSGGVAPQRGYLYSLVSNQYLAELMPYPGASWCVATGINASNQVCGYRSIGSKGDPVNPFIAFVWSSETGFTDLGVMLGPSSSATDISNDRAVVGWTGGNVISAFTRGFVRRGYTVTILQAVPGGVNSTVRAMGDSGYVLVSGLMVINGSTVTRSFAYDFERFVDLDVLPGHIRTFAQAMDANGQILGYCTDANGQSAAFIWRDRGIVALNTLVNGAGAIIREPSGVAASGAIVGAAAGTSGQVVSVVLSPIARLTGDTNCDLVVNVNDLLDVINQWGKCVACSADLNGDQTINGIDLLAVVLNWR